MRPPAVVLAAVLAGCAETASARDASLDAADARADVPVFEVFVADVSDVSDVNDASDVSDASDVNDVNDVNDVSDARDARDVVVDSDPCGGLARCDGVCRDITADRAHCGRCGNACPSAYECVGGACVMAPCVAPLVACDGECRDVTSDPRHCGGCGCACAAGQWCSSGFCVVGCGAGLTACGGGARCFDADAGAPGPRCVDTRTDRNHCGMCSNACPDGDLCRDGACAAPL